MSAIENLAWPELETPKTPPNSATVLEIAKWKINLESWYDESERRRKDHMCKLYFVILGQCTSGMRIYTDRYEKETTGCDGIELLKFIKDMCFGFSKYRYLPHAMYDALLRFYTFKQGPRMSNQVYQEKLRTLADVIMYNNGSLFIDDNPAILQMVADKKGKKLSDLDATDRKEAKECFYAVALILQADKA